MERLFSIQISGETYCCSSDQPLTYSLPTCLWCSALPCSQLHCKAHCTLPSLSLHCFELGGIAKITLSCSQLHFIAHCALRIAHCKSNQMQLTSHRMGCKTKCQTCKNPSIPYSTMCTTLPLLLIQETSLDIVGIAVLKKDFSPTSSISGGLWAPLTKKPIP